MISIGESGAGGRDDADAASPKRCCAPSFWLLKLPVLLLVAVLLGCNFWVILSTNGRIFESPAEIESRSVGLVLGTSRKVAPNTPNRHFDNRIAAAVDLFEEGKVEYLLVSGHRDSVYYDETRDMIARLLESGVPETSILSDDQGARTFDSVARAKSVFGFDRVVIVSDDFHVGRALFIADRLGLDAIALKSEPVSFQDSRKVRMREYLARVKAVMDVYLLHPNGSERAIAGR